MRMRALFLLVSILMLATACQDNEDILPVPQPAVSAPDPVREAAPSDQGTKPLFDAKSEIFQEGEFNKMPFRILFPRGYDPSRSYPLHIFLHGIGERGTDNKKQLSLGATHFQADSIRDSYPAFVVFPQCPDSQFWVSGAMTAALKGLIDHLITNQSINKKAVSISGFSMGAYGTFAMAASYPDFFKSAIAISGDGDQRKASLMAKSRWRLFAGAKDNIVPSYKTQYMASALADAGASVSFKLYPTADHGGTWFRAFSEPDFFYWLFAGDYEKGG